MKVLVAVDLDMQADSIAQLMTEHCWGTNTEFLVLKVVRPLQASAPTNFLPPPVVADLEADKLRQAEAVVKQVAGKIIESLHTVHVDTEVCEGFPAETILDKAQAMSADLIVLGAGRKQHGALMDFSVLGNVTTHAKCPVLIVRDPRLSQKQNTQNKKHRASLPASR